jgi:CRP/FNR family transcriptional regulator, anaerobic regulatory protein
MQDSVVSFSRRIGNNRPFTSVTEFSPSSRKQTCTASGGALAADPALTRLFFCSVAERFSPPRAIFWEADAAMHVFYLLEGSLRISRTMQDGRRAILGFAYAGDLLGISFRDTYLFTAEAVNAVRLKRLPRRRFDELIDRTDLRLQLLAEIRRELMAAQDQIVRLGRTSADERVATFLLNVARRAGSDSGMAMPIEIDVPFGRLDIADYLGLTVETVSREISKLKRDGLISTRGPHKIVLKRLGGLCEVARMEIDELHEKKFHESGDPQRRGSIPLASTSTLNSANQRWGIH